MSTSKTRSGWRAKQKTTTVEEAEHDGGRPEDSAALTYSSGLADLEQSYLNADQTASDGDQTASDADQADSDDDQQRADLEQRASDREQEAADREAAIYVGTAAQETFEATRAVRADASATREATSASRSVATHDRSLQAAKRDETARLRDLTAASRDLAANERDRIAAHQAEYLLAGKVSGDPTLQVILATIESLRRHAAADRERAANDRRRAAADRMQAAADRLHARVELRGAQLDGLTGVYRRDFGRVILQHAIDRAHRSREPLVLAFVDVDGLKEVNDQEGHAAGDALLQSVAGVLLAKLRPYDIIVRIGGDEFVCGLTNTEPDAAKQRFEEVGTAIAAGPVPGSISVGLASLRAGDTLDDLTDRADVAMYTARHAGLG